MVTHMLQRAWGQGAVCTTGRVRGGALLSKDAKSCVSPPNDSKAEGIHWIAKSSAGGRHCWKSDETGRFVRPPRGRPGYILLSCGKELN